KDFLSNMEEAGILSDIVPMRMLSVEAAKEFDDEFFDLIFIDGGHDADSVSEDISAWLPKLKNDGFLLGHDIHMQGVVNGIVKALGEEVFKGVWYLYGSKIWSIEKHNLITRITVE
ncbi:unnamed protein product, partial [marine sediment metagenome]